MRVEAVAASQDLLRVEGLKAHFFTSRGVVRAVDGVSLRVGRGEAVGLVGESGCGKTVTALSVMRLVASPPGRIVAGEVRFEGRDLLGLTEAEMRRVRGARIAMVFQDPMTYLNPVMRVGEQVAEAIRLHQGEAGVRARVQEILELVGLPRSARVDERYAHELSGGIRQRALLAIALACRPALLIADEPTTALDVSIQAQILQLLRDLRARLGMSLLLITHDLGVVAELCDRVYVMYAGRMAEEGDAFPLFDAPRHPYTRGLLDAVLSIDEFKETLSTIEGVVPDLLSPPPGCRFHPRCPRVMDRCRAEEPPPFPGPGGGAAWCWLHAEETPQ